MKAWLAYSHNLLRALNPSREAPDRSFPQRAAPLELLEELAFLRSVLVPVISSCSLNRLCNCSHSSMDILGLLDQPSKSIKQLLFLGSIFFVSDQSLLFQSFQSLQPFLKGQG